MSPISINTKELFLTNNSGINGAESKKGDFVRTLLINQFDSDFESGKIKHKQNIQREQEHVNNKADFFVDPHKSKGKGEITKKDKSLSSTDLYFP